MLTENVSLAADKPLDSEHEKNYREVMPLKVRATRQSEFQKVRP